MTRLVDILVVFVCFTIGFEVGGFLVGFLG